MASQHPPSVDAVARAVDDGSLPRPLVVETVRAVIERWRADPDIDIETAVGRRLAEIRRSAPRRVINATGVILHTNLGRAPWSPEAVAVATDVAAGYSNTELDLESGDRGTRNAAAEQLVRILTGAEDALLVNNNAAALFLVLLALAGGRPVPVSRGELIEIGGSYRLPELMAATGSRLVEVGTTNRTRREDYAGVDDPALVLKVHASNYRIVGFTEDTSISELAELAEERGVPLVHDIGSGLLDEDVPWLDGPPPTWLRGEPGVRQSLAAGSDLVLFSGDKLVGGPQGGILVGRSDLVARLRRHPAARALRVDGPTSAALAATFAAYLSGEAHRIPLWRMATLSADEVRQRAQNVAEQSDAATELIDGFSTLGAGSAPGAEIPTTLIRLADADAVHDRLLQYDPPILARRSEGHLLVDLRTVDPSDDRVVATALSPP